MQHALILATVISAVLLSGCATQLNNIKSTTFVKEANNGNSVVFGRLTTSKTRIKTAYLLQIKNTSTSQVFHYSMRSWGCATKYDCNSQPFCFLLPSGDYKVVRIQIYQGNGILEIFPDISFSIKPMVTNYIGTLIIGDPVTEHDYLLWSNGNVNLQVSDENYKDQKELANTCPGVKEMDYKFSLMEMQGKNIPSQEKSFDPNDLGIDPHIDYSLHNLGNKNNQ